MGTITTTINTITTTMLLLVSSSAASESAKDSNTNIDSVSPNQTTSSTAPSFSIYNYENHPENKNNPNECQNNDYYDDKTPNNGNYIQYQALEANNNTTNTELLAKQRKVLWESFNLSLPSNTILNANRNERNIVTLTTSTTTLSTSSTSSNSNRNAPRRKLKTSELETSRASIESTILPAPPLTVPSTSFNTRWRATSINNWSDISSNNSKSENGTNLALNISNVHEQSTIPHVRQSHHWDCGAAALKVANSSLRSLECILKTKSVWTIDLAYLMKAYHLDFLYTTITLGVNSDYTDLDFYSGHVDEDKVRVAQLFVEADQKGILIQKRNVEEAELISHLKKGNPAIVLVNQNLLRCRKCHSKWWKFSAEHECSCPPVSYIGHYLVAFGYDEVLQEFQVRDPGRSQSVCFIPSKQFELARKSFGTDEDLLLITFNN